MSEYTFETAALKAVTIDAVKYNEEGLKNSLTPEAIQQVVPMAWGSGSYISVPTTSPAYTIALGRGASCAPNGIAIGLSSKTTVLCSTSLGMDSFCSGLHSIALAGRAAASKKELAITIGSQMTETTPDGNVYHTCITEGTGSITIGAGANTLNNGDTESSNSVTIGCKAENKGADSVVIGAQASGNQAGAVVIGTGAKSGNAQQNVVIGALAESINGISTVVGYGAKSSGYGGVAFGSFARGDNSAVAIGGNANCYASRGGTALGDSTKVSAALGTAIGAKATVSDYGATVIRSTAEDGTYTQLYFSGANTPLAKKYFPTAWEQKQDVDPETGDPLFDDDGNPVMVDDPEKPIAGEAMMGFVAKDSAGNIIARGANMLSALFPYYTGEDDNPFQPTGMSLRGGEKPEPVAFHPSDLDMVEEEMEVEEPGATEPTKPFVYKPLPVYPIVEPEIEDIDE